MYRPELDYGDWRVTKLRLSTNNLGKVPHSALGNLAMPGALDLSGNHKSGLIPTPLGSLSGLKI